MDTFLRPSADIRGSMLIKTTSLQRPKIVGFYSSNKLSKTEDEIRLDASNCKYFKRQLLNQDKFRIDLKIYDELHKDYEQKYTEYSQLYSPMALFLEYLEKFVSKDNFVKCSANKLFDVDIICHVDVLLKMMMVHGDFNESFSLSCTKYKGNIYIKKVSKSHNKKNPMNFVARHALFADHPNTDVNTNVPYTTRFHCVYDWNLRDSHVKYFSVIQGVNNAEIVSETDLSKIQISGTNLSASRMEERKHVLYRTPFWWCQSFLLGISEIHTTNINEDEVIDSINTIGLDTVLCGNEKRWKKSSSERVSFLSLMLDLIKLRMTFVNCPWTVYEFEFNPRTQSTVHYKIHHGRNEFTFLTDRYVNAVKDL